jgi:hypothetical protein
MTIYILDNDPKKIAEYLDDNSLDKMIKGIAQVLCNVHHDLIEDRFFESAKYSGHCKNVRDKWKLEIPLKSICVSKNGLLQWSQWARECTANYFYLVELAEICSRELNSRFEGLTQKQIDNEKILIWARDNVPDLPNKTVNLKIENFNHTEADIPVICPPKYMLSTMYRTTLLGQEHQVIDIILSYQNYYRAKLLSKWLKSNENSINNNGDRYSTITYNTKFEPKWTKRNKPEGLELKNGV